MFKQIVQNHAALKWQNQNSNPGFSSLDFDIKRDMVPFIVIFQEKLM
jgi:hypothetical protein